MFLKKGSQTVTHAIQSISQRATGFISGILTPVTRIFSPTDDNYPTTGVQPFEGEPANKNRSKT